jgi:hypothetical protein
VVPGGKAAPVSIYPPARASATRADRRRPQDAILYAILDDVRTTLRMGWVDPAIRAVSSNQVFFAAAWSATRPNVTRSFALGAERLRSAALAVIRDALPPADHRPFFEPAVPASERERAERTMLALHWGASRVLLVVQAWAILARRQRIDGTGVEESPAKRGIPAWQEGLVAVPRSVTPEAEALLDDATVAIGVVGTPPALQTAAQWPHYLEGAWRELQPLVQSREWQQSLLSLRRVAAEVLRSLPHPMDLQWDVLSRRGLPEKDRAPLADHLTALAAAMPVALLVATYLAEALGTTEAPADW